MWSLVLSAFLSIYICDVAAITVFQPIQTYEALILSRFLCNYEPIHICFCFCLIIVCPHFYTRWSIYALVPILTAVILYPYLIWSTWALAVAFITVITLLQPVLIHLSIGYSFHHWYELIATSLTLWALASVFIAFMTLF